MDKMDKTTWTESLTYIIKGLSSFDQNGNKRDWWFIDVKVNVNKYSHVKFAF